MELFRLFGSVLIDDQEAINSLKSVDKKGETTAQKLGNIADKGLKIGTAIVAGTGAAIGGLMALANGTAETADKWDKLSLRTGIAVENLQEWGYAAGQSGADIDVLENGIKKLSDSMVDAQNGSAASQEAYEALGISMQELSTMTPEQAFERVMYALGDMEDGALKNSIGNDLLGRSFTELKPLIAAGSEGMEDLKNRASELGLVMSEDAVGAGVVFGDTLADAKSSMTALKDGILADLLPRLTDMLNWFIEKSPQIREVAGNAFEFIGNVIGVIADNSEILIPILGGLLGAFMAMKVISIISGLMTAYEAITGTTTITMGGLNAVMMANPIGLVIAAIAALIAIGVALYMNWDKIKETAINAFGIMEDFIGSAIEKVKGFMSGVIDFVKNNWQGLLLFIVNPFAGAFKLLYDNVDGFKEKVDSVFNGVVNFIKGAIDKIKGFFKFEWKLPDIKLPHFSINGKFSLNPPSIPKIGIDWYAKGGIFDEPTIFNTPYGLKGVGDASSPEVVSPLSDLKGMISGVIEETIQRNMLPLASADTSNQPIYIEHTTYYGDEVVLNAVKRAEQKEKRRYEYQESY